MREIPFSIGDELKVKSSGKIGKVRKYKHERYMLHGKIIDSFKYDLDFGYYSSNWFDESDLQYPHEIDPKLEAWLTDLMFDNSLLIHNKYKNLKLIHYLHNEKQKYKGC